MRDMSHEAFDVPHGNMGPQEPLPPAPRVVFGSEVRPSGDVTRVTPLPSASFMRDPSHEPSGRPPELNEAAAGQLPEPPAAGNAVEPAPDMPAQDATENQDAEQEPVDTESDTIPDAEPAWLSRAVVEEVDDVADGEIDTRPPRTVMNPFREEMGPDEESVASNPELIELAESEPVGPQIEQMGRVQETLYMSRRLLGGSDTDSLESVEHFLKEERVLDGLSEGERQAFLKLRAAAQVEVNLETQKPVSFVARPGLATAAWRAGRWSVAHARFRQPAYERYLEEPEITRAADLDRTTSGYMLGRTLDAASEGHLAKFIDDQSVRVGYGDVMRGLGIMAQRYATEHNLTETEQQGLLDGMLRRITYKPLTRPGRS